MKDIDFTHLDIVKRYKANYSIPKEVSVSKEMVLQHWALERQLTDELLNSTKENRWEIFEKCYTELYHELAWLNTIVHASINIPLKIRYRAWTDAIGPVPQKIYEIGSGKGTMISYLSTLGHSCKATEITRERGGKFLNGNNDVELGNTDGIHLDQFEEPESYDVLLSDQVIEHMHPDDVLEHFKGAFSILKTGGRYIFSTPHIFTGPHDVSKVFGSPTAIAMHLKEYTFKELSSIAKQAGFKNVTYANKFSSEIDKAKIGDVIKKIGVTEEQQKRAIGAIYYNLVTLSENAIALMPGIKLKKAFAKALHKVKFFSGNIFLEVTKL